jgi:hypothetical protein
MSFLNPAPINNDELNNDELNNNFKKFIQPNNSNNKNKLKKTIKKRRQIKNSKVNDFLDSLNNDSSDSDDDNLGDFKQNNLMPLPKPQLISKKQQPNHTDNYNKQDELNMLDSAVTTEQFKSMESNYNSNYINQYVPYSTNVANTQELHGSKDVLLEKLNYMIHLLEEQQEEKTGHVTEELILYSFLGVFMIFVVDSFARVGKYVR